MPKPTQDQLDVVLAHHYQIGLLCAQWAYLEWMLEVAIWWFSDLLDTSNDQRLTETGGKPISVLAREAGNIAHHKLRLKSDIDAMQRYCETHRGEPCRAEPRRPRRAHTVA